MCHKACLANSFVSEINARMYQGPPCSAARPQPGKFVLAKFSWCRVLGGGVWKGWRGDLGGWEREAGPGASTYGCILGDVQVSSMFHTPLLHL